MKPTANYASADDFDHNKEAPLETSIASTQMKVKYIRDRIQNIVGHRSISHYKIAGAGLAADAT